MIRTAPLALSSALTVAMILGAAVGVAHGQAPAATFASSPVFNAAGQASAVFLGGTIDQLEAASSGAGASGAWAQDASGAFQLLVVGGPSFLKDAFKARLPGGLTGATAITLTRAEAPTGAPPPPSPASSPALPSVPASVATPEAASTWASASAPAGASVGGGDWIAVDAPEGRTILAQVFRPAGAGPFPAVVLLHGQGGFTNTYLQTGSEIARAGFVTVVGCWFAGNYLGTSNAESPTPVTIQDGIACPAGPALKSMTSTAAVDDVAALVTAARTLPGIRADRVALVGNSRGSITALLSGAVAGGPVQAIGAIAGAPPGGALLAFGINAPVLLLQGEADTVLPVANSRALEAALSALGRPVQSHYYPGAPHDFFFDARWHEDALARLTAFLDTTLAR